jgi:hypothetical protein
VIRPLAMAWQNIAATARCLVLPVAKALSSLNTSSAPVKSMRRNDVGRAPARSLARTRRS